MHQNGATCAGRFPTEGALACNAGIGRGGDVGCCRFRYFRGAHLQKANFDGAYLLGAIFAEAETVDMSAVGANFTGVDLSRTVLFQMDLSKAMFSQANLQGMGRHLLSIRQILRGCTKR